MYYEHFGLNAPPFRITPDTRLFYAGGNRGAILDAMVYAITTGEGITKVVGEVGSGKTMLCRMLEVRLPENVEVVYLANPSLSPDDILHAIAFEMKLPVSKATDRLQVMRLLQEYLLEKHASNHQVVVFVEEAQGMPLETLEEIRLLSNLETQEYKLLQIVLFGQPELESNLSVDDIRQLRERITHSFQLPPLALNELGDYVSFRMRAAGYKGPDVFTRRALKTIARYSNGLIRRTNILADKALLASYASGEHAVTARHVKVAAADSEFGRKAGWRPGWKTAFAAGVVLATIVAVAWFGLNRVGGVDTRQAMQDTVEPAPAGETRFAGSTPVADGEVSPPAGGDPREAVPPGPAGTLETWSPDAVRNETPRPDSLSGMLRVRGARSAKDGNRLESEDPAPPNLPEPVVAVVVEEQKTVTSKGIDARAEVTPVAMTEAPLEVAPVMTGVPGPAAEGLDFLKYRIAETRRWLDGADREHFSIQLMLIRRERGVKLASNLRESGLRQELDKVWVYETSLRNQEVLSVLLDEFDTYADARTALGELPHRLLASGPFVRNISDIKGH